VISLKKNNMNTSDKVRIVILSLLSAGIIGAVIAIVVVETTHRVPCGSSFLNGKITPPPLPTAPS